MIRAYVVDDERLAVQRLTRLLEETGRVTIAGGTTDSLRHSYFCARPRWMLSFSTCKCPG